MKEREREREVGQLASLPVQVESWVWGRGERAVECRKKEEELSFIHPTTPSLLAASSLTVTVEWESRPTPPPLCHSLSLTWEVKKKTRKWFDQHTNIHSFKPLKHQSCNPLSCNRSVGVSVERPALLNWTVNQALTSSAEKGTCSSSNIHLKQWVSQHRLTLYCPTLLQI